MAQPISRTDPALRAVFDLAEHLTSGQRLPSDSRELLKEALEASIASGFELSLFASLGLKKWGGISPLKQIGLGRRDRSLCRMYRRSPEWAELSPAAAAKAMVASFRRYEAIRWPRERNRISGPTTQPNSTWWSMLRAELSLPGEKRLGQILQMEIQDRFEFPAGRAKPAVKGDPDG